MKKLIVLIISIFLLSGCYDYQELNDVSIINGIGIDYKDDKYLVSLEITKSSKESTSSKIETFVATGKDENIITAFDKAITKANKKVYMQHIKALILGESICKEGINEVLDYIIRDVSINNNYYIVVTDDAKEIFDTKTSDDSVTNVIVDTIDANMDGKHLDDLDLTASTLINKRIDIALPYVSTDGEEFVVKDIVYFNDDKYEDKISNKVYNFLKLNTQNNNFSQDENTVNFYKNKISYDITKEKIIINIKAYGKIMKISPDIDLSKTSDYEKLENEMNEKIEEEVNAFFDETLNNDSDIMGLNDKYYKKYKKSMNEIKYEVNVDVKISKNGTMYEVLHD